ncbi:hypothetical protein [Ruegeria faecimaris]|uniref:Secreted protein n=1 Tax=Ruegeria faecimaris TaxID=686389 RepID=A0A521BPH9_9RHOB|nr:hypothetical protein [Ruegeria faecimaris]SMO49043.1 hypothetical protein SAMN06265380_1011031 [Ruegeria faecimaris]
MKKVITSAVLAAATLFEPGAVTAAPNGFQTVAVNDKVFEVIPRARRDVDGYWCAAADFARRSLGAGWQQNIYVVRGYGPSEATGRRTAVQFSLTPPANVEQSTSFVSIGFQPGQSRSVQNANGLCFRQPIFD